MAAPCPPVNETSDADLIRRAMTGQREAFAEIYRRYHTAVYRFARMMSGSRAIAEDVTQETFTSLLRDLPRYAPERAALPTYLYGVARNLTRTRLRRERRFVGLDLIEDDDRSQRAILRSSGNSRSSGCSSGESSRSCRPAT